jgi:hypothetical protein
MITDHSLLCVNDMAYIRKGEFYAATEGNVALLNSYNQVGAVGYLSPIIRMVHPGRLVKFDIESEMPVRDPKTGFCIGAVHPFSPGALSVKDSKGVRSHHTLRRVR